MFHYSTVDLLTMFNGTITHKPLNFLHKTLNIWTYVKRSCTNVFQPPTAPANEGG